MLDDKCFILDNGVLVASHGSKFYTLDPVQQYLEIRVYPDVSSSDVHPPKRPHSVIGVAGSDTYKTLPVDLNHLYPTYPLAVAAAVKGRRDNPVDIGILIYFPQKSKYKPSYMVSPYYNGGVWRDDKHCFAEQISDSLIAYQTNSDFGLVKTNAHLSHKYGPVFIGHVDRFRPPGRISSALVANYRYETGQIERHLPILRQTESERKELSRNFSPMILNDRKCRLCNARKPSQKCKICLVPYCDKNCQRIDWSRHKQDCKQIASIRGLQTSDKTGLCDKFMTVARDKDDELRMDEHFLKIYQTGIENSGFHQNL